MFHVARNLPALSVPSVYVTAVGSGPIAISEFAGSCRTPIEGCEAALAQTRLTLLHKSTVRPLPSRAPGPFLPLPATAGVTTSTSSRRRPQHRGGLLGAEPSAQTARDEVTDQRVQPTDRLGAQRREVVVAIRQQSQHGRVIDRSDGPQTAMTQRDDRCGPRGVRVGLVGATRIQQPHARRQRGRHINNLFARGDELLRQQRAEPSRRLDRPGPRRKRFREPQQPITLASIRDNPNLADDAFLIVEHRRGVRPLMRVDPNNEHD
jgi:hypothetical protein